MLTLISASGKRRDTRKFKKTQSHTNRDRSKNRGETKQNKLINEKKERIITEEKKNETKTFKLNNTKTNN